MRPSALRLVPVLFVAVVTAACKQPTATEAVVADALTVAQGNGQSVQAGLILPTPVVVRITDKTGVGMANIPITFVLSDGGGSVNPASAVSDTKGEVTVRWTLGPLLPLQTLTASAPGVAAVKVQAQALLPTDLTIAQGNNQSAKIGAVLPNMIVVRVTGAGNTPMVGIPVAFQVSTGGGAISPQTMITNALGEATAKWTVGTVAGTNTALISTSTLTPVFLTAIATP